MYARSLSRLSLVFAFLYVLLVVSAAIPPKLLDYDWISRVTATLINGSSMPLLALLVLVVGNKLYPENQLLYKRRLLFSRLAGLAVLGFLFLVPVHIYMGILQQTGTSDQARALDASEQQLKTYRQAANQASSVADLQQRMSKLGAPALNPAILARPLPDVQAQLDAGFDQIAKQITQQRQALAAQYSWRARAPQVLRIVIACLVLAFGFASFTSPTPTGPVLMDSVQDKLATFRLRTLFRSGPAGRSALRSGPFKALSNSIQAYMLERRRRQSAKQWNKQRYGNAKRGPLGLLLSAMQNLEAVLNRFSLSSRAGKPKKQQRSTSMHRGEPSSGQRSERQDQP